MLVACKSHIYIYVYKFKVKFSSNICCFFLYFYRTFALIKPDGIKCKGKILKMVLENGFRIGNLIMVQLKKEQAEELYIADQGQSYFPSVSTACDLLFCIAGYYNCIYTYHKWSLIQNSVKYVQLHHIGFIILLYFFSFLYIN